MKIMDTLMSITQAAKYLNLAEQTLYNAASTGELAKYKRGRRVLFAKADLDAFRPVIRIKSNREL